MGGREAFFLVFLTFLGGCARVTPKPQAMLSPAPHATFGLAPYVTHKVTRGETLYRIAHQYGVETNDLMRANSIWDPRQLEVGHVLIIPRTAAVFPPTAVPGLIPSAERGESLAEARRIIGPRYSHSDWRTITLHHSATLKGSAKLFHRDHMRRKIGGLFYHFVVGNGSYTEDGKIEMGWRWKKQKEVNRPYDIQICLVGNFSKNPVTEAQFESLVNLIRALRETYQIPTANIRRHQDIKGKNTECPGKHFPFHEIIYQLQEKTQN